MRIAIFDYLVKHSNPTGGCHLRILRALAQQHEFTVFSVEFDNPCPERITWVRIPAPVRPLALLFVSFHVLAPLLYWLYRLRTGVKFDLIQKVESNLSFGTIAYSHFCHTAYLKHHWAPARGGGLRTGFQKLDHLLHAGLEGRSYSSARQIVVPSRGLAKELQQEFAALASKVKVVPNAIDIQGLECPGDFDRTHFRQHLGIEGGKTVFLFVALGQFERKGLRLLVNALTALNNTDAILLVVGGNPDLVEAYRQYADQRGLKGRVLFAGMQSDVRPYLWAADAFVFPSSYETFSLVAYEAAAASLPLITPLLHGIEEIVSSGKTGYIVEQTIESLSSALAAFLSLPQEARMMMGERARSAVLAYREERFIQHWQELYQGFATGSSTLDYRSTPVHGLTCYDNPDRS